MVKIKKRGFFELNNSNTLLILIFFTFSRIFTLLYSELELTVDEAQYWDWSKDLKFGYFSKPPLIAWLINISSQLFGNAEWAIRIFAPIFHFLTAIILWKISIELYDKITGKICSIIWITLPSTALGSFLFSTDTPLLFFWTFCLLSIIKYLKYNKFHWLIIFTISLSFGTLTKYAMLYFFVILIFFYLLTSKTNEFKLSDILKISFIFLLLISPNIYWNIKNNFSTLNHTIYNADLNNISYNFNEVSSFLFSQLFVFGPIFFIIFLLYSWVFFYEYSINKILAFFSIPIVILITILAFLKTSNANWALTAYPCACIIITRFFVINKNIIIKLFLALGLIFNIALNLYVIKVGLSNDLSPIYLKSNPLEKINGYQTQSKILLKYITKENPKHIVFTNRNEMTKFNYYLNRYIINMPNKSILGDLSKANNHYTFFYNFEKQKIKRNSKIFIVTKKEIINLKYLKNVNNLILINKSDLKENIDANPLIYIYSAKIL